jgi:antitoxin YefM
MRTINFSDARSNLKKVLDTVADDHDITLIKRRDAEDAVVMSLREYNSWRETIYLMSSPENARRLKQSLVELDAGKGVVRELVEVSGTLQVREPKAAYGAAKAKPKHKAPGKPTTRKAKRG